MRVWQGVSACRGQRVVRRREAELAEMLKKEALILSRAITQPAKPNTLKIIKAG